MNADSCVTGVDQERIQLRVVKTMGALVLISAFLLILLNCYSAFPGERVLFDFEGDSELDQCYWRCHTLFSLSEEHVSHGTRSLRLELYPSDCPGFEPMIEKKDWRRYEALVLDIHNPEEKGIEISLRIDDRKDYPKYEDRYNKSFVLAPGMNGVRIPLDTLFTSGTGRKLDLKKIHRLFIFMVGPKKRVVLYVDYIRLVS